jgi:hypothetical protein
MSCPVPAELTWTASNRCAIVCSCILAKVRPRVWMAVDQNKVYLYALTLLGADYRACEADVLLVSGRATAVR